MFRKPGNNPCLFYKTHMTYVTVRKKSGQVVAQKNESKAKQEKALLSINICYSRLSTT